MVRELDYGLSQEEVSLSNICQLRIKKNHHSCRSQFKELKTLVYDYRDRKEEEIINLNNKHEDLKTEIENNQKNYEQLIEQATDEISNFINKANSKNLS